MDGEVTPIAVKPKPKYIPKPEENFWFILNNGDVTCNTLASLSGSDVPEDTDNQNKHIYYSEEFLTKMVQFGNCFPTQEEAQNAADAIKKLLASG